MSEMSDNRITEEQLVDYVLGALDQRRAEIVALAIERDAQLARREQNLRRTMSRLAADDTQRPSPHTVRKAVALFDARPANALVSWLERVEREIARIAFDSRATPALAGFRGDLTTHQLAYESGLGRIDLQVTPDDTDDRRVRVRGQVTPAAEHVAGTIVAAPASGATSDDGLVTDEPDEHGQFLMTMAPGHYALHFEFDDGAHAVTVPDLDIP